MTIWGKMPLVPLALILTCSFPSGADEAGFCVWRAHVGGGRMIVEADVSVGCYLSAAGTRVDANIGGVAVVFDRVPEAEDSRDGFSGSADRIYPSGHHEWSAPAVTTDETFDVTVEYQGCREASDDGPAVCFPPRILHWKVNASQASSDFESFRSGGIAASGSFVGGDSEVDDMPSFRVVGSAEGAMATDEFIDFLRARSGKVSGGSAGRFAMEGWIVILLTLLGGLGLNLAPCVLPMIPVSLAVVAGTGKSSRRSGALYAGVYGAGMAAAYGTLGTAAVLTGARFGAWCSSPWFNWGVAAVMAALALAAFGVWHLDFSRWSAGINPTRMGLGRAAAAFLLGAMASLLAGACVAPVLTAVIVFAVNQYAAGNSAGLLLPYVLGIGMALPWPLMGAGMAILPRPGRWTERVNAVFGSVLLLAAGYYVCLGFTHLPGRFDPDRELNKVKIALTQSLERKLPVLIDFWSSWCRNCREMDRRVLADPAVERELKRFIVVRFQAEDLTDPAVAAFLNRFGFNGLPAFAVIEPLRDSLR